MPKESIRTESVGDRIRKMRKDKNLELSAVAETIGCAPEYLEDIEANKVAPPVGMLIQISRALAVDTAALLAEERRKERHKSYRKRTKSYSYKTLNPGAEDKHLWAYLVTLAPEKDHEMVEFKHEGEEFVHVMEGKAEIQVGDEVNVLKKGQSLHFNSAITHKLRNLSAKETKLLVVVYTP
ncbi:MAG: cupin domain-containing protein [Thermodesulfobacteriota bacterium]